MPRAIGADKNRNKIPFRFCLFLSLLERMIWVISQEDRRFDETDDKRH